MGAADSRCDFGGVGEGLARPSNPGARPTPFVALLFAHAIAEAALLALPQFALGLANFVPRVMLVRTMYSPGPGVFFAVAFSRRMSSRSRYCTSRKPGGIACPSPECTGLRRAESGLRRGVDRPRGEQSRSRLTFPGPVFVATSPQAWRPPLVLTPLTLSAWRSNGLCCALKKIKVPTVVPKQQLPRLLGFRAAVNRANAEACRRV